MGLVMIRCPKTGRELFTGMEADRASFNRSPVFFGRTFCPTCGTRHEWFAKDAWVREGRALLGRNPRTSLPGIAEVMDHRGVPFP